MDREEALLRKLIDLYDEQGEREEEYTFFGVIGRERDEDLISRMLAHIFKNNPNLCAALFEFGRREQGPAEFFPKSIVCEQNTGDGRIDLFLEAEGATLTIENKINSFENGDQTARYFRYVSSNYRDEENRFLYLKPNYNTSEPSDRHFTVITYGDLLRLMESSECKGVFEADFMRHIEKYLIKWNGDVMESDRFIFENYQKIMEPIKRATRKYEDAKRTIDEQLLGGNLFGGSAIPSYRKTKEEGRYVSDCDKTYRRISKNKLWWNDAAGDNKTQKYYFYLELVLPDDPAEITTQMAVRVSGKPSESVVYRFMLDEGNKSGEWRYGGNHFVSSPHGKFKCNSKILSDEWMEELFSYIKATLSEYSVKLETLFSEFHVWKSAH